MPQERTDVIEFDLGAERYCLATEHVSEIARIDEVTPVPDAGRHVRGVTDLRGRTTTVFDLASALSVETAADRSHVLVLADEDAEDGESVGWLVGNVHQVRTIDDDEVDVLGGSGPAVTGVVHADDGFIVRLDPAAL